MIDWTEFARLIASNPNRNVHVPELHVRDARVDNIPVFRLAAATAQAQPQQPPPAVTGATLTATVREPHTTKTMIDPIVLGIELVEPLYDGAPARTRHQMETEEAQRIELRVSELYGSEGGRSRGWTKVGLDNFIKPRCASGGNSVELDRAKKAFPWQLLGEDKVVSGFLDFLCVAKQIRVAVWFEDTKLIMLYPAADAVSTLISQQSIPLYHVTCKGERRVGGSSECRDLYAVAAKRGFSIIPPLSVLKSLSSLTLDELKSVGEKMGVDVSSGAKQERVARLAAAKLKQRLGVV